MTARTHDRARSVTVLANSHCPHCVHELETLTDWAVEAGLPVAGVDLWKHPEAGEWMGAESSPIVVFEARRDRVHVGMPSRAEFQQLAGDGRP